MKYALLVAGRVTIEVARILAHRENETKGSGDRFIRALQECYALIAANPNGFQVRKDPYRHAFLPKLKYRVVYRVKGENIYVVQVRHTSQKPSRKFGP